MTIKIKINQQNNLPKYSIFKHSSWNDFLYYSINWS